MKTLLRFALLATLFGLTAGAEPKTDDEKTLYTVGLSIGRSLQPYNLSKSEQELIKKGLQDALAGVKPSFNPEDYGPKINDLLKARAVTANKAYLDKVAAEKGAVKTSSGLVYFEQKAGSGPAPKSTDTVKVNYKGTLTSGSEFDSSYKRGKPAEFPLNGVIPCWTEGLQKMKVGGKARLVCPPAIGYGERGNSSIPPNSVLNFEVELLEIVKTDATGGGASPPPPAGK